MSIKSAKRARKYRCSVGSMHSPHCSDFIHLCTRTLDRRVRPRLADPNRSRLADRWRGGASRRRRPRLGGREARRAHVMAFGCYTGCGRRRCIRDRLLMGRADADLGSSRHPTSSWPAKARAPHSGQSGSASLRHPSAPGALLQLVSRQTMGAALREGCRPSTLSL